MKTRYLLLLLLVLACGKGSNAQPGNYPKEKLSNLLRLQMDNWRQQKKEDSLTLVLSVTDVAAFSSFFQPLRIVHCYLPARTLVVKVPLNKLAAIFSAPTLVAADLLRTPKEEITTGAFDPTVNKVNFVHHRFSAIRGSGITVSVKETRFDKADIDFKGRWIATSTEAAASVTHATIMATLLAGGGNSSPLARGVAWGARLASSDFALLLPDADSIYQRYAVSVQNHSYGVGIENVYGSDAAAYDMSVYNNPGLVHVFSAGNIGTATPDAGPYAGVQGYANLTGSFKMAKNILTVGAVDSFNNVVAPSSRGPAFDGRVKPDLVAYGEGGSSGAAAVVSGAAALLQQAYRDANAGRLPPASLVRAVLVNAATDIAAPQVDYSAGFGNLDVHKALTTVLDKRFFVQQLQQGEKAVFTIRVPANTRELKVTLAWTDSAAAPNTPKALVNDLNMRVVSPAQEAWLPWVLRTDATKDSLALPARRGVDSINNIEQITLDFPAPGDHSIEITGTRLLTRHQAFSVAYQTDTVRHFLWTYPTATNPLTAGEKTVLRWKTTTTAKGNLEFSTDGLTWHQIASGISLEKGYHLWQPPMTDTLLQLRAVVGTVGLAAYSDTIVFTRPLPKLSVGFDCKDSVLLYWNRAGTATQLYRLGEFYMEPFAQTVDTFYRFQKQQHSSLHYAAAPILGGRPGKRSAAIDYQTQGVGCYFANFLVQLQDTVGHLSTQLGTLYNVSQVQFLKGSPAGYRLIKTVSPHATLVQHTDSLLTPGVNRYKVQLLLQDGRTVVSDPETIYYLPSSPLLVFPNPVRQSEPVQVMVTATDEYTIEVYDVTGRKLHSQVLTEVVQSLPSDRFGKGVYFIKCFNNRGEVFTTKLLVY